TDSPFLGGVGAATTALQHLLNVHASHPAYLRVDGRPVVFFWRPTLYGVQTWANIRAQADPNRSALWISEGVDTSYLSVFDGHHLYSNTWNPPADLGATNQKFAARVGADRIWVATVMPGYNDVKIRPGSGFARDREGGAYYERAWQAAIDSNPRWIVINSFNEWPEGSHIEPSAAFGDLFLGLTATWSARFKNSSAPGAAPLSASTSADAPVAETITEPTAIVTTAVLNLRAGPGTDFALLGRVVQGNRLPIVGRSADSTWWQVKVAGGDAWVFGELVRPVGIVDATPVVDSPMQPTAVQTQSASQSSAPTAGFTITVNGQSFTLRQVQPATP
ncbi:MAG: SH3 domain-containing protein, partial [Caldilinea sp.]